MTAGSEVLATVAEYQYDGAGPMEIGTDLADTYRDDLLPVERESLNDVESARELVAALIPICRRLDSEVSR